MYVNIFVLPNMFFAGLATEWKELKTVQFKHVKALQNVFLLLVFIRQDSKPSISAAVCSPVATGGFGGLSPSKQSSKPPQMETWNAINKWSFG